MRALGLLPRVELAKKLPDLVERKIPVALLAQDKAQPLAVRG